MGIGGILFTIMVEKQRNGCITIFQFRLVSKLFVYYVSFCHLRI